MSVNGIVEIGVDNDCVTCIVDAKASANEGEIDEEDGATEADDVGFGPTLVVDAKASANGDRDEVRDGATAVVAVVVVVVVAAAVD